MKKTIFKMAGVFLAFVAVMALLRYGQMEAGKPMTYTLTSKDGQHYIVFDNIKKYSGGTTSSAVGEEMKFPSVKEMKDAFTKGTLTERQKAAVAEYKKDETGAVLTCDFNNLYDFVLPAGGKVSSVVWSGECYYGYINFGDEPNGVFSFVTQSQYQDTYLSDYEDRLFNNNNVTVTREEKLPGNKQAVYWYTSAGEFKNIRYTLSSQGKTFIVDKEFYLRLNHTLCEESDTVPHRIKMYCTEGGKYYRISLSGFEEDPTDEWLLSFGLTKYVENDHVAA